jgi:hypothetical protein
VKRRVQNLPGKLDLLKLDLWISVTVVYRFVDKFVDIFKSGLSYESVGTKSYVKVLYMFYLQSQCFEYGLKEIQDYVNIRKKKMLRSVKFYF